MDIKTTDNCRPTKQQKRKVSAATFRPASNKEEVIILPQTEVKVALKGNDDDPRHLKFWIEVSVKSLVRPGLWGHQRIDPDATNLEYLVAKAAETIANYQCTKYADQHNPPAVVRAALDCLKEMQRAAAGARRTRGTA